MIASDAGNQRYIGIDNIDRIQAPAQTHLKHHGIQRRLFEQPERGQGAGLEVGQRSLAAGSFDSGKRFAQLLISSVFAIDLHPLVVTQQVRRTVYPDFKPLSTQQYRHEGAGRALAVGAGHGNHPWRRLVQPEPGRNLLRTRQAHVDGRGVQLLEIGEPVAKGTLGHTVAGAGGTTIGSSTGATNVGVGRPIICASRLPRR
ncbi:hypothetical protein D3C72_1731830 [compost metagenome]